MKNVSVIIPTYNRQHTLKMVIGSYLAQEPVGEIIFVADGCTDNTITYLKTIVPNGKNIRIIENHKRRGLPYSKNRGIDEANYEFIFIGEDDVYLSDGHISHLMEIMQKQGADIVGGRVLYMSNNETYQDALARFNNIRQYPIDFETFDIRFGSCYDHVIEVPILQSLSLIKNKVFEEVRYDPMFNGSAFREETDFYIRCRKAGKRILWTPGTVAYNLPPALCKRGGLRETNRLLYELSAIINNYRFLLRHYGYLKKEYKIKNSLLNQQLLFTKKRIKDLINSVKLKLLNSPPECAELINLSQEFKEEFLPENQGVNTLSRKDQGVNPLLRGGRGCVQLRAAAIVSSNPLSNPSGGVERFNYYLENFLCQNGYSVDYYHPGTIKKNLLTKIKYLNIILRQYYTGRQITDKSKYSLIISNGGYGCGLPKKKNIQYLNFHHGTTPGLQDAIRSKISPRTWFLNKFLTYGLAEFLSGIKSKRIAVGNSVKEEVKKYFNSDSILLNNSIDTNHFTPKNILFETKEDLTCLFIARFDYWMKGFDFLEKLIKKLENVRWILIISGNHNVKPAENVSIFENINYDDLPAFYKMSDIGFYLSRYEGNSFYLLECLASGLPVIATSAGEAKYIYKNETLKSLLIKSSIDNASAVDEVCSKVNELRDINKRIEIGKVSRKIIEENYSLDKWERTLTEIINKR